MLMLLVQKSKRVQNSVVKMFISRVKVLTNDFTKIQNIYHTTSNIYDFYKL